MPLTHPERAERRQKIAAYCVAHPLTDAVKQFKVSRTLAQAACAEHGVTPPASPRTLPDPSRLRLIAALVNTTKSYSSLGVAYGVTRQAIEAFAKRCTAAGLKVRARR